MLSLSTTKNKPFYIHYKGGGVLWHLKDDRQVEFLTANLMQLHHSRYVSLGQQSFQ
jgi:hypothetical protein